MNNEDGDVMKDMPPPALSRSTSLLTDLSLGKAESLMDILVNDMDRFNAFLDYMKYGSIKKETLTTKVEDGEKVKAILTEFGGMRSFSRECQKWIKQQTYPFLSIDVVNPTTSSSSSSVATSKVEKASINVSSYSNSRIEDTNTSSTTVSSSLPPPPPGLSSLSSDSVSNEEVKTKNTLDDNESTEGTQKPKVKKRMTPSVVSTVVSPQSSTFGNIASLPDAQDSIGRFSQAITNSSASTPVKSVNRLSQGMQSSSELGAVRNVNISGDGNRSVNDDVNSSSTSLPSSSYLSPDKSTQSKIITRSLSSSSETFSRFLEPSTSPMLRSISSNSLSASPSSKSVALEICNEESYVLTTEKKDLLKRLAKLYCALVLNNYLNISTAVPFLAKIASLRMPLGQLVVKVKESSPSSIVDDTRSYKYFIVHCVRWLCPILCSMGSAISGGFAEAEAVREAGNF